MGALVHCLDTAVPRKQGNSNGAVVLQNHMTPQGGTVELSVPPRLLRYAEGQWSVIDINGRVRGSPAQTPWVCGAEEEESCLCHRYQDLWRKTQTPRVSEYNTISAGREPTFRSFSETYLSCDQQPWMKSFLPQRCPGENKRHGQLSGKAEGGVLSQPFAMQISKKKDLGILDAADGSRRQWKKKPIRVSQ